jgi:hypothetical protein
MSSLIKSLSVVCFAVFILNTCTKDDIFDNLPVGDYESNDHVISLKSDGSFIIINIANINDNRNFEIRGSFTYTRDKIDEDNDSYGKITFTAGELFLEGSGVNQLYLDDDESFASLTSPGDVLEGWWAYSDNITWEGKMRIWFNWPGFPRENNFYDGHNELYSGDP